MLAFTLMGVFLPLIAALLDSRAAIPRVPEPEALYLERMCRPNYYDLTSSETDNDLYPNSKFPCEQQEWIRAICMANGTVPIDFLAEQQCLCNGAYFDLVEACDECFLSHGWAAPVEEIKSSRSSIKSVECSTGIPIQPYINLMVPETNITASMRHTPTITPSIDRFPNDTAVSNYYTPTRSEPGVITGVATARRTSITKTDHDRYTPYQSLSSSGSTKRSATSSLTTPRPLNIVYFNDTTTTTTMTTTITTSANGNGGRSLNGRAAGGLLAVMIGVVILL